MPGWAQERFIVTPNRGGADGARQTIQLQQETNRGIAHQVSITALETDLTSVSATATSAVSQVSSLRAAVNVSLSSAGDVTCGNAGMLLGPSHTMAINRCIPSLTIAPTGRVVLPQGIKIGSEGNCDASGAGTLRYEAAQRLVQFCDGTAWQEVGAAPTASGPFTAVTGANPSTAITSNAVTVTGFAGARTATATGGATIMVNGVAVGSTASVNPGDSVALRVTSSASFDTAVNVGFSVTSISANWSVTTRAQDTTPNAFSFTNLTNQAVSTTILSDVVTVGGFDGPLSVSISGQGGPQIQISGGAWVASGAINPGNTLRARLTTSSSFNTVRGASVSLGTFSANWTATTMRSPCNLPWGGTIDDGASLTFYSATLSSNCAGVSQSRTCSNGTLSGSASFQYASCNVPTSCVSAGQEFQGGRCATLGNNALIAAPSDSPTTFLTQADAVSYCSNLSMNNYDDWYLPNINELERLFYSRWEIGGFSSAPWWTLEARYWPSTPGVFGDFSGSYFMYSDLALVRPMRVRCVRQQTPT